MAVYSPEGESWTGVQRRMPEHLLVRGLSLLLLAEKISYDGHEFDYRQTEGGRLVGRGFYYTMAGMTRGRTQTAARANGVMRAALLAGLRYAEERKMFGALLIDLPLTGARLSKMAARYAASRHLTYSVARMLARGCGRMEASLVKLFACRSAEMVTREAMQLYGGMGYAEEIAVSRYFVDARVLSPDQGHFRCRFHRTRS